MEFCYELFDLSGECSHSVLFCGTRPSSEILAELEKSAVYLQNVCNSDKTV